MTIPDFQTARRPALALLADGETRRTREIIAAVADEFGLTDEEREQQGAQGSPESHRHVGAGEVPGVRGVP